MIHWPGGRIFMFWLCMSVSPMNSPSAPPCPTVPHSAPQLERTERWVRTVSAKPSGTFRPHLGISRFGSRWGWRIFCIACRCLEEVGGLYSQLLYNIVCMYINYIYMYVIFICITKGRWGDRRKWGVPLSRNPTQNLRYAICATCRYLRLWQNPIKFMDICWVHVQS